MPELMIDFITSLDGYGAAEGWPGWWGLEGPRVPRLAGRSAGGGLHGPHGRKHLSATDTVHPAALRHIAFDDRTPTAELDDALG